MFHPVHSDAGRRHIFSSIWATTNTTVATTKTLRYTKLSLVCQCDRTQRMDPSSSSSFILAALLRTMRSWLPNWTTLRCNCFWMPLALQRSTLLSHSLSLRHCLCLLQALDCKTCKRELWMDAMCLCARFGLNLNWRICCGKWTHSRVSWIAEEVVGTSILHSSHTPKFAREWLGMYLLTLPNSYACKHICKLHWLLGTWYDG